MKKPTVLKQKNALQKIKITHMYNLITYKT